MEWWNTAIQYLVPNTPIFHHSNTPALSRRYRTMPGALQNLRVIDFTHALAGPFCVMLLGHLGADIIKVEPPNGDEFRRLWMQPGAPTDPSEALSINFTKKTT